MTAKDNILSQLYPQVDEACELTIACRPTDYCASQIAHAVEDCNAHLLNLNVTDNHTVEGDLIIALRANHLHGESIARSLQRYGYEIININRCAHPDDETMRQRVNELLHYIEI